MKFSVKIGFRIISIMVATSKKNTAILKNTISARQKRILQLSFPLVETIIEIRMNPFFLKITLLLSVKIRRNPIFKKLFWLGTDSRAFFLLVGRIVEIRRNPFF